MKGMVGDERLELPWIHLKGLVNMALNNRHRKLDVLLECTRSQSEMHYLSSYVYPLGRLASYPALAGFILKAEPISSVIQSMSVDSWR